jgi:hypothetical protein
MYKRKYLFIIGIVSIVTFSSCITNSKFENSIEINAPASVVFSVITDYESYHEILPALHDKIKIISAQRNGPGVAWESTGTYKGHRFTTTWTVTEYIQDRLVTMKDLKDGIGYTTLQTEPIDENKTRYTMLIGTKMYRPYEQGFIDIYRDEIRRIKVESERRYDSEKND